MGGILRRATVWSSWVSLGADGVLSVAFGRAFANALMTGQKQRAGVSRIGQNTPSRELPEVSEAALMQPNCRTTVEQLSTKCRARQRPPSPSETTSAADGARPHQSHVRALTALKAHALRTGPDAFFNGCRRVSRATCGRARGFRRQAPRCRQGLRAPNRRAHPSSRGTRARCR